VRPLIVDLGREYRGGQHQALLLLRGLLARGHKPELITLRNSLLAQRAFDAGVPVHGVAAGRKRLAATLAIRRFLRSRKVDLVHANEPHALSSGWLAGANQIVPMIASRRIALPISSSTVSQARYRGCARIVAVSQFVAQSVASSFFGASKIEVIYDGVEIPSAVSPENREGARNRFAIPHESVCIGNVAAFVPEKGQELLIRAFAELRGQFPKCVLLLAGDGPEKLKLEGLVRQLGLDAYVRFPGFVPDVENIFAATDIFVFPSHEEPLGSSLLSAMAYGLPVVAIARGGVPEVVENNTNGLLVKDLESATFAEATARLLTNATEAQRLGDAGRETISARFSADRMVDGTLRLYEAVTGD
jgi:glycosyltransferase involved in cell wall biosynthesis